MTTPPGTPEPSTPDSSSTSERSTDEAFLVVDQPRFALVPEWVIDAKIPDSSFRLYSLLLRYGATSGARMPSRATLARRMQRSTDAVDRAMKGLVEAGIVTVERRRSGAQNLTNRYYLRSQPPGLDTEQALREGGRTSAATPAPEPSPAVSPGGEGGRESAATPGRESAATPGRESAATGGRTSAGRVAADLRPDRESSTDSKVLPPPPTPSPTSPTTSNDHAAADSATTVESTPGPGQRKEEGLAIEWLKAECGIEDLTELTAQCVQARETLGKPTGRWAQHCIVAALQLAVRGRNWPAAQTVAALLQVAADPKTISPMRLAEAGPWWDQTGSQNADTSAAPETTTSKTTAQSSGRPRPSGRTTSTGVEDLSPTELVHLEARLVETDGERIDLQFRARKELSAEGIPVTRATVTRRACQILDRRGGPIR